MVEQVWDATRKVRAVNLFENLHGSLGVTLDQHVIPSREMGKRKVVMNCKPHHHIALRIVRIGSRHGKRLPAARSLACDQPSPA
jgi:hypothetical protein